MKQVLLISFDIIRKGEPNVSLAIGSLLSYLKASEYYLKKFVIEHQSFNLYEQAPLKVDSIINEITSRYNLRDINIIAISCYVWSDRIVNDLIRELRINGFCGKIILGGNQISYSDKVEEKYPDCQVFISGYGEDSLLRAICDETTPVKKIKLSDPPDFERLPSPYLSNTILLNENQEKIRFETKRGCEYNCKFCAHKDLLGNQIYHHSIDRIYNELSYFKDKSVKKINFVDPTFNSGGGYLEVLKYCNDISLDAILTLQVRHENINGKRGDEFLELCNSLNVVLEFGLQSIIQDELSILGRNTNLRKIETFIEKLYLKSIPFEASLIYGIPGQTIESFQKSIDFLIKLGCKNIKAFGLMLLTGTELWSKRDELECSETCEGRFDIPYVTSSGSFTREDWKAMREIARNLTKSMKHK
jgi:radical SAM superfamily enzyme YgiQ (UPF0313 family)